jgi:hypothetical protein
MTVPILKIRFIVFALILSCPGIFFPPAPSSATWEPAVQCTRLLEAAGSGDADAPHYAFGDFETGFDPKIQASTLEYFKTHPDLLEQIRTDLGGKEIQWSLGRLSHRLLYATETRQDYVIQFESYCREVIGEVLHVLELPNPYSHIVTLTQEAPSPEKGEGFSAYIVRDLVTEYQATYEFSNTSDEKVLIELSGQLANGEVGSYSSSLTLDDKGGVHFLRDTHTIWQNSAKNPYTVLMTPVEETLHILLRESTEAAIRRVVESRADWTLKEIEKIVAEWISVEEAIVGGLVYHLLPPILERRIGAIPDDLISADIKTKEQFLKYDKLGSGIRLVAARGTKACLELYLKSPEIIKELLT